MTGDRWSLADLGWNAHLRAQVEDRENQLCLVRVMAVHRDLLDVAGPGFDGRVHFHGFDSQVTVGDWLELDDAKRPSRLLERYSVFKRKAPGAGRQIQLLAANVDTVFLVTSANDEFNPARLERYVAIARDAMVSTVVVVTKADLVADRGPFLSAARRLAPGLIVEPVDARKAADLACLHPWLGQGQTVALLGSSGVGKSTLANSLAGGAIQATAAIREADAKGRHTTTRRSLHRLASGAWLLDTPGMRELQLVDAQEGIAEVFDDVAALAGSCRFADCRHDGEPGCAIQAAVASGRLDADRITRYRKLMREDLRNSESIAEARARSKQFGRMAKEVMASKARRRDGN